ncbi:MAG: hypothetical protein HY717_11025 [Planctomycetes bacterium]|nr:hypothetical protein [Planctomycetota bacterium]
MSKMCNQVRLQRSSSTTSVPFVSTLFLFLLYAPLDAQISTPGCCPEGQVGGWLPRSPIPTGRDQISAAVVDGIIYVLGAHNHDAPNNRLEAYKPGTDSWQRLADIPTGRGEAAAAAVDRIIYFIGGNNCFSNCWLNTNEAYDPSTDTWRSRAPMPTRRGWLTANAVGGKIYVIGGGDSYVSPSCYAVVEIYDPATDSWSSGSPMPHGRCHSASAVLDGKIYIVGGWTDDPCCAPLDTVLVYDPVLDTWTEATPLSVARGGLMAAVAGGKIYAVGGNLFSSPGVISLLVEEYDPSIQNWRRLNADLCVPRFWGAASPVENTIYVFGGANYDKPFGTDSTEALRVPGECTPDCNGNGVDDTADIANGSSADCNANGIPDECDERTFFSLKQTGPDSFDLIVKNHVPILAGEVPILLKSGVLIPMAVEKGPDFPPSNDAEIIPDFNPAYRCIPEENCGGDAGLIIAWLNSKIQKVVLPPGEHQLLRIRVRPAPGVQRGDCTPLVFATSCLGDPIAPVKNIVTDENGQTITASICESIKTCREEFCIDFTPFRRGDTNGDGEIDVTDAVLSLVCLFVNKASCSQCTDAEDSNDDGIFDISDPIYSLVWRFTGGPAPPPPLKHCGHDPTDDGLSCVEFSGCK